MSTRDIDRGWKNIKREILLSSRKVVAVGILEGSTGHEGESIAEYAAHNEFGTEDIPSRPFTAMSVDENKPAIIKDMREMGNALTHGKRTANACLTVIGMRHAARVQQTITGRDILPRLAQSTVDAKGSTKTLVDSSAMVNAVQIELRRKI